MPIYPVTCAHCAYQGDTFARVKEIDEQGRVPCPACGQPADQDYAKKTVHDTNTRFTLDRQRSRAEGFLPKTVGEARRLFGEGTGHMIQSDGRVLFKDRRDQEKFYARKAELLRKARAKRRAKGLPAPEAL